MNQIGKEEIAEKGDCLKQNAGADREKQAVHEKRHENRYAEDKPKDCSYCFFWKKNETACGLGEENCYYLIQVSEREPSLCDGCPYRQDHPCIGWCTKKLLCQGKKEV